MQSQVAVQRGIKTFSVLLFLSASAFASEPVSTPSSTIDPLKKAVICAALDDFDGHILILDSSRSAIVDAEPGAAVPCSGWVSVQSGWATLHHRDGAELQLGAGTFLKFESAKRDEPIVLYRGQAHVLNGDGSPELRILTANARVRVAQGRAIVIYREDAEETQLVGVERLAKIESRFEEGTTVTVAPGFESHLHQRALRMVPSPPAQVTLAELDDKLRELHLPLRSRNQALRFAKVGQERKTRESRTARRPAGLVFETSDYVRHRSNPEDERLKSRLGAAVTGGASDAQELLHPTANRKTASKASARIMVDESEKKNSVEESKARRKLIDELSSLKED